MKPDHEAAKKWAKRMRWTPEALTEEEINFARAYLDLLAQLEQLKADKGRAVMDAKLEYAAKYIHSPDGEFTFPDGDSVECSGGASYSDLVYKVAELERELEALTKMAREATPDYPFDPKHPLPLREAVYGLTQALEGTTLACGDLWKELEAARKVCATATCINQGYKNGVYEIAARDKPEHELAEAFFASLDSELAAYHATKERTDG